MGLTVFEITKTTKIRPDRPIPIYVRYSTYGEHQRRDTLVAPQVR